MGQPEPHLAAGLPSVSHAPPHAAASPVPFFDVGAVNEHVDVMGAFERVLGSKHYVLGKEVSAFEGAFAGYLGAGDCVGVGNGTDALELSLRTLGVGQGSRVLLAANAAFYGSAAVHAVGAVPIYVDVSPGLACLDPAELGRALSREADIACIIVTHLYGNFADMPAIMALAKAYGVHVLEDCAQAHGARGHGSMAGTWGAVASFSFYPTKNLGAIGDGGAIVTSDANIAARARALRQYGWGSKYAIAHPGGRNSRLDELQAAVLTNKLPLLDAANARRRAIAKTYTQAFSALPVTSLSTGEDSSVAHLYVIQVAQRARLARALEERGIQTAVHYPQPDHLQPAYPCAQGRGTLPVTEAMAETVLSLPCHPGMDDAAVERVVCAVRASLSEPWSLPS